MTEQVFQIVARLSGVQPAPWRRLLVPASFTFWDLHVALQDAFGWLGGHLHEFTLSPSTEATRQAHGDTIRIGVPDSDDHGFLMDPEVGDYWAWDQVLADWLSPGTPVLYRYDFGDNWEVNLHIEKALEGTPIQESGATYSRPSLPRCLAGEVMGPPEYCGGTRGFATILENSRDAAGDVQPVFLEFDPRAVIFRDPRVLLAVQWGQEFSATVPEPPGDPPHLSPIQQALHRLVHLYPDSGVREPGTPFSEEAFLALQALVVDLPAERHLARAIVAAALAADERVIGHLSVAAVNLNGPPPLPAMVRDALLSRTLDDPGVLPLCYLYQQLDIAQVRLPWSFPALLADLGLEGEEFLEYAQDVVEEVTREYVGDDAADRLRAGFATEEGQFDHLQEAIALALRLVEDISPLAKSAPYARDTGLYTLPSRVKVPVKRYLGVLEQLQDHVDDLWEFVTPIEDSAELIPSEEGVRLAMEIQRHLDAREPAPLLGLWKRLRKLHPRVPAVQYFRAKVAEVHGDLHGGIVALKKVIDMATPLLELPQNVKQLDKGLLPWQAVVHVEYLLDLVLALHAAGYFYSALFLGLRLLAPPFLSWDYDLLVIVAHSAYQLRRPFKPYLRAAAFMAPVRLETYLTELWHDDRFPPQDSLDTLRVSRHDLEELEQRLVHLWEIQDPSKEEDTPVSRLDQLVDRGRVAYGENDPRAACDAWLAAWDALRKFKPVEVTTVAQFAALFPLLRDPALDWTLDLAEGLSAAGQLDPRYHRTRIEYCESFLATFPDEFEESLWGTMRLGIASAHFALGDLATADAKFHEVVVELPVWPWGLITWGDHYAEKRAATPEDWAQAKQHYLQALALIVATGQQPEEFNDLEAPTNDEFGIVDRLRSVHEELGISAELEEVVSRANETISQARALSLENAPSTPNLFLKSLILDVVKNQVQSGDPPITRTVLERLVAAGVPRAEALEKIATIFLQVMFTVVESGDTFDRERYRERLADLA